MANTIIKPTIPTGSFVLTRVARTTKANIVFVISISSRAPWNFFRFARIFRARGRQIVGRTFAESAFGLKICECLRREREELGQVHLPRLVFDVLNQLPPNAAVFVQRIDVKERQLALFLLGINVQRHARDRIFINLKNE